jgi:NADPH:quinone reductase-like Zn-dependent oxidoreductase
MTCTLLCIDSSPRAGDRSHSRWLTARFEEVWRTHNPMVRVVQPIIGSDVSGIIEAVGDAVTDFRVGDEVYCTPQIFKGDRSYAEYHLADESIVAHKPKNLSHFEVASLTLAGGTAWEALVTRGKLQVGESILIHAGAGGVGSIAIQLANLAS